jgi:hypothetical protein
MRAMGMRNYGKNGKFTYKQVILPTKWVNEKCPTRKMYVINIDDSVTIGIPSNREDILYNILPTIPRIHELLKDPNFSESDIKELLKLHPETIPMFRKLMQEGDINTAQTIINEDV